LRSPGSSPSNGRDAAKPASPQSGPRLSRPGQGRRPAIQPVPIRAGSGSAGIQRVDRNPRRTNRVASAPRSDHATPPPAAPVDGRAGGPKPLRYNPRLRNGRRASRPGTRDAGCRMTAVPKSESGSVATRTSAVCAARVIRVRPETPSPCPLPERGARGIRSLKGERDPRTDSKGREVLGCTRS